MRPLNAQANGRGGHRRHDPAPSRWSYRLQRIMLTPHLLLMLRIGAPILVIAGGVGIWLADQGRREALVQTYVDLRTQFEHRPQFMVNKVAIDGCSDDLAAAVQARLNLNLPQSSFDLDLEATREQVEKFNAVKSAEIRIQSEGVLSITITARDPVAVWRTENGLALVDESGHRIAGLVARADRGDLPLIAGTGADRATSEALEIMATAGPLVPRIRGLVRVGERRWDIVLDRDQRIMLPEDEPVPALERLLALDHAQNILARDLVAVDLRLSRRPTLRLAPRAPENEPDAEGGVSVESAI